MYAYKFNASRMKKQKMMLPINSDGNPDWDFMEQYMKRIENDLFTKKLARIMREMISSNYSILSFGTFLVLIWYLLSSKE